MVAGEVSGDRLGAALMRAIRQQVPEIEFEGIGGEHMLAEGLISLAPMEMLSVMGIGAILRRLPQLLVLRRRLTGHWKRRPPDVFVGVDAPEFNLPLAERLRRAGTATVHCVCPSIWAWRPGRIKLIRRAVDHMLVLFPFETELLSRNGVKSTFVGHPMIEELSGLPRRSDIRATLGLDNDTPVLCLLPGSRATEVAMLAEPFLKAAERWLQRHPDGRVLMAAANEQRFSELQEQISHLCLDEAVRLEQGRAREFMKASDIALVASGTATLECALLQTPMVAAYRVPWMSYQIFSRLSVLSHYALPNILLPAHPVPELLQGQVTPELLLDALERLEVPEVRATIQAEFQSLKALLASGDLATGAKALIALAERRQVS
jgi:lipid-A-disaccharide synthase